MLPSQTSLHASSEEQNCFASFTMSSMIKVAQSIA